MVTTEGAKLLLRMMLRGDDTLIPAGGNFYVGLCNQVPTKADLLSSITTEPTIGVNGYARQIVTRDATGWQTETSVGTASGLRSLELSFIASGGAFDQPVSRAFLCDVATGFVGSLFAYTGSLAAAFTVNDGVTFPVEFEYFLD